MRAVDEFQRRAIRIDADDRMHLDERRVLDLLACRGDHTKAEPRALASESFIFASLQFQPKAAPASQARNDRDCRKRNFRG